MSIIYPSSRKEVFDRVATDIQANLPESEPFLRNSYIEALGVAYAGALYDAYQVIKQLQLNLLPDTATGEFADRWASFKGIIRKTASQSKGLITITGIQGTIIPLGTFFQSSSGAQYYAYQSTSIQETSIQTYLTRSGNTVTARTSSDHHFVNGMEILVSGAVPSEYNGLKKIVVIKPDEYTFEIDSTPISPAIGFILSTATFANCPVSSFTFGHSANLAGGSSVSFTSIVSGADTTAYVQFEGLSGGSDLESDEDFRNRYLYAYQHPVSYFNVAEIVTTCQKVAGVTRVFVQETTPDVGQVTIYFMRDNDENPIPTSQNVTDVKAELLKIKPAHVDKADVIVAAPTPQILNFSFSSLEPNTETMRQAINNSLEAFFSEVPAVGEKLSSKAYNSAIYYTVDPSTGELVKSFTLAEPIGDKIPKPSEIYVLGTITWP